MYIDRENLYCGTIPADGGDIVAQSFTATAVSDNVIDHGQAGYGEGEAVDVVIMCTETFAGGTFSALVIELQTDDNSGFSSATVLKSTGSLTPQAGDMIKLRFDDWNLEQFSRLNINITGSGLTGGELKAFLQLVDQGVQSNIAGRMDQYGQL